MAEVKELEPLEMEERQGTPEEVAAYVEGMTTVLKPLLELADRTRGPERMMALMQGALYAVVETMMYRTKDGTDPIVLKDFLHAILDRAIDRARTRIVGKRH